MGDEIQDTSFIGTVSRVINSRITQQSFIVLFLLGAIWLLHTEDAGRIAVLEKQEQDCIDSNKADIRRLNDKYEGLLKMYYFGHDSVRRKIDSL